MQMTRKLMLLRSMARFAVSRRGSVMPLAALCMIPLIGVVALAVDYGRATSVKSLLQASVDAAALGAAKALSAHAGDPVQTVTDYLATNFTRQSQGLTPAVTTVVSGGNTVRAMATVDVPTRFAQVLGVPSLPVKVEAIAKFGLGSAEVALVLDNTGSMDGAKLDGLKQAAKSLVDVLYDAPNSAQMLKVGLVPFTYYVNVGTAYRSEPWMNVAADTSTTQNECWDTYPNAVYSNPQTVTGVCYNDGVGSPCSWTTYTVDWGQPVQACGPITTTNTWNGCVGSRPYPLDMQDTVDPSNRVPGIMNVWCSSPLSRLTNSASTIKAQIDAMTATGETYIASGLLWGWRVLSPNAPFADGAPYGNDRRKIMVLMTDGANTKSPNYPDHEGTDVVTADNLTAELCGKIKAAGIQIYTISFAVGDQAAIDRMAACASGPPFAYNAGTIGQLQDAFRSIGEQLVIAHLAR